jgi:hypothetical protein
MNSPDQPTQPTAPKLNQRQRLLAEQLAAGVPREKAARAAGYTMGAKSADAAISNSPRLREYVRKLKDENVATARISREQYIGELADAFMALPKDSANWPRAADLLAKACGFNEAQVVKVECDPVAALLTAIREKRAIPAAPVIEMLPASIEGGSDETA